MVFLIIVVLGGLGAQGDFTVLESPPDIRSGMVGTVACPLDPAVVIATKTEWVLDCLNGATLDLPELER